MAQQSNVLPTRSNRVAVESLPDRCCLRWRNCGSDLALDVPLFTSRGILLRLQLHHLKSDSRQSDWMWLEGRFEVDPRWTAEGSDGGWSQSLERKVPSVKRDSRELKAGISGMFCKSCAVYSVRDTEKVFLAKMHLSPLLKKKKICRKEDAGGQSNLFHWKKFLNLCERPWVTVRERGPATQPALMLCNFLFKSAEVSAKTAEGFPSSMVPALVFT